MNKHYLLLFATIFTFAQTARAQSGEDIRTDILHSLNQQNGRIEGCYAHLKGDTLVMGNQFVERKYKWNKGGLVPAVITNKSTGEKTVFQNDSMPDLNIESIGMVKEGTFEQKIVPKNATQLGYLVVEITTFYEGLTVKRLFKIYPDALGITAAYHLKKTLAKLAFAPTDLAVERLILPTLHWTMEAVEFFDDTDENNNLTKVEVAIPYRKHEFRGNLLFLKNMTEENGLFLLKEAPCSFVQNNYPGHDFKVDVFKDKDKVRVQSTGLGVTANDLPLNKWVHCFGYVLGIHDGSKKGRDIALRSYQHNIRETQDYRDESIMVNTWGDRSKDGRITEAFIRKELIRTKALGISHFMIDDGWQQGLSKNSAVDGGKLWGEWQLEDWLPHKGRFPNGFAPILKLADSLGIKMGLWFHPSDENEYAKWEMDANILIELYKRYKIRYIKIDGIRLPSKQADINLQSFFQKALKGTDNALVFCMDATADERYGYHYRNYLGLIFLENRYTDLKNYYPHHTLRNVWTLAQYMPVQRLQIEFLNKWRNVDKYGQDPFAPSQYPFDYLMAIAAPAQPLAWFEVTGLPEEADSIKPWIKSYTAISQELHNCYIFPIGEEPSGRSFTGFQFMESGTKGYILVFRELTEHSEAALNTYFESGQNITFTKVFGKGSDFITKVGENGAVSFRLPETNAFSLFQYSVDQ